MGNKYHNFLLKPFFSLPIVFLVLIAVNLSCSEIPEEATLEVLEELHIKEVPELSGICFGSNSDRFYVVGDEGTVAEIGIDGTVIRSRHLGKYDLEGIAYDSDNDRLIVIDERTSRIYFLDPENFDTIETMDIIGVDGKNFEGIAYFGENTLVLVDQSKGAGLDKAGLWYLSSNGSGKPFEFVQTGIPDQSGISIDSSGQNFYVISDTLNLLYLMDPKGQIILTTELPGKNQEGIAVNSDGMIFVVQDRGSLMKIRWMVDNDKN